MEGSCVFQALMASIAGSGPTIEAKAALKEAEYLIVAKP